MRIAALAILFSFRLLGDWTVGLNFRGTSGYVTDGADETYVLGETSPTTRKTGNGNEVTFNWDASPTIYAYNRNASIGDVRLAGINLKSNASNPLILNITLPSSGTYRVRMAIGDANEAQGTQYVKLMDNGSVLLTVSAASVAMAHFIDASGVDRTAAAWPTDNAYVDVVFATTTCQLSIGPTSLIGDYSVLAHLYLEKISTASISRRRISVIQ